MNISSIGNQKATKCKDLAKLRHSLQHTDGKLARVTALGIAEIDQSLPWKGLPGGCLHEVAGLPNDGAALGFTAWLTSLLGTRGWVLWCRSERRGAETGQLYGPALAQFGIDMRRLLFVKAATSKDLLWAMEEGLRARRFAAVIGEGASPNLIQTRRLQLAAETGGATALMILPSNAGGISAAMTRWAVRADVAETPAQVRWHLQLARCRGGAHGAWHVEWNDETLRLGLSAPLADRLLVAAE